MIPGKSVQKAGNTYTSNSQGFRSLTDFSNDDRYQVLLIGDSFTFGDDADDRHIWPWLLQEKDTQLNILNMGGTGYGVDQMLITLEEELPEYAPDLVIASFISDDLVRSTLSFRDYQKPRFTLDQNDELQLENIPVPDPDTVASRLEKAGVTDVSPSRLMNLLHNIFVNQKHDFNPMWLSDCDQACIALNTRIIERMNILSEKYGAEFMLVYLPCCAEMVSPDFKYDGHAFFHQFMKQHNHAFLDLYPVLTSAELEKHNGHYQLPEARIVSEAVYQKITSLDSWKAYNRQSTTHR